MATTVKQVLKRARVSQPFNVLATSAARGLLQSLGIRSEIVVRHLHRAGEVRCRLPNQRLLRLWSRGDDWVSNQVFWRGLSGYEPEPVPIFWKLAASASTTFDVGAYVGFYTLLAAHANPVGRIFAFEPHPNAYARLIRNVGFNAVRNVECLQVAVGAMRGSAEFYCGSGDLPTSSSLSEAFMRSAQGRHGIPVCVVALDDFVQERGIDRVGLLKIDTESTEPAVLEGMRQTLTKDRPPIISEVLQNRGAEERLQEILGPLGYRYYLLTAGGPQLVHRIVGHPEWLNYLFLPDS